MRARLSFPVQLCWNLPIDDRAPHVDVTCDGTEPMPLFLGERLVIRRSPKTLKMLKIKHAGFFSVLNAKLSAYELKN